MAGEIEFFDSEPDPDGDEHLHQPDRHRSPGKSLTVRILGGVAVAAVIVGALVARVVTGNGGSSAAAPSTAPSGIASSYGATSPPYGSTVKIVLDPSSGLEVVPARHLCPHSAQPAGSTPIPGGSTTTTVPRPRIAGVTTPTGNALVPPGNGNAACVSAPAATCPEGTDGLSSCTTVPGLPTAAIAAVHDRFPKALVTSSFTEIARETRLIWYRSVMVSINPDATIEITLEQSGNDPRASGDQQTDQDFVKARAVHTGEHLNTIVEYTGSFGRRTSTVKLTGLAADHRLASVS